MIARYRDGLRRFDYFFKPLLPATFQVDANAGLQEFIRRERQGDMCLTALLQDSFETQNIGPASCRPVGRDRFDFCNSLSDPVTNR